MNPTNGQLPSENESKRKHKDANKHLDYTKIADRLRTVSWNNYLNWCG